MISSSKVWVKMPRAGLGNKILLWANAYAFSLNHHLQLVTSNWVSLHIGPWLRGEKSKRFYTGYFNQDSFLDKSIVRVKYLFYPKIYNPDFNTTIDKSNHQSLFIFHSYKFWMHYFDNIRNYRSEISKQFHEELLKSTIKQKVDQLTPPTLGIHIRMGDFKELASDQKFDAHHSWCTRTPLSYFINAINNIRCLTGISMPVTIFSDGTREQLGEILALENTTLIENNRDIIDLLLLSKSKIIIPSPSSTFSLFAAFLSDAVILHHPNFYMRPLRPDSVNNLVFESPLPNNIDEWPEKLKQNIILATKKR